MAENPQGTIQKPVPQSADRARSLYTNSQIKTITKLKIQEYIESFFSRLGENSGLLKIVSPKSIYYNIDKSFNPQVDPTQQRLQIARYFNELKGVLPAVLVMDGGIIPAPQSIGQVSDAQIVGPEWHGTIAITRKVPITIAMGARDQEFADEMSGLVSLFFNELRNVAGGSYLTGNPEQGDTWVIYLPNEGVPVSAVSESDIPGDPVDKMYSADLSFEAFFEDKIQLNQVMPSFTQDLALPPNTPDARKAVPPIIHCPDIILPGQNVTVFIERLQQQYRVIVKDPNIATLSYNMVLTPRKIGTTKIQVIDPRIPDRATRVIAEKEISVGM